MSSAGLTSSRAAFSAFSAAMASALRGAPAIFSSASAALWAVLGSGMETSLPTRGGAGRSTAAKAPSVSVSVLRSMAR